MSRLITASLRRVDEDIEWATLQLLQWGRDHVIAEIRVGCATGKGPRSFNGAAIM